MNPFKSYEVSHCDAASMALHERVYALAQYLDDHAPLRLAQRIQLSLCSQSCARHQLGDIAIQERSGDTQSVADIWIGGQTPTGRRVAVAVPWAEMPERLKRLLRSFIVEQCPRESFREYVDRLDDMAVRERLGLLGPVDDSSVDKQPVLG